MLLNILDFKKIVLTFSISCLVLFSPSALAINYSKGLESLAPQQCNLQNVIDILTLQSYERSKPIHENMLKDYSELQKIIATAPDKNKPIGEQLSPINAEKFSTISQRINTMNMSELVESRYERDLQVIKKLVLLSDNYYRWQKLPGENDPDALFIGILASMIEEIHPEVTPNNSEECNMDYVLYKLEEEPLKKLSRMNESLNKGIERVKQIYEQYPTENRKYASLNNDDKKEVDFIRENIINPSKLELMYIENLENIRLFAQTSELIRTSYLKDIVYSGGNIDHVGDTIRKLIKNGDLSEEEKIMLAFWQVINEMIPSDKFKEIQKIIEIKDAVEKPNVLH